jgi:hypothetical protein
MSDALASPIFGFGLGTVAFSAMFLGRGYLIRYMKWVASLNGQRRTSIDEPFARVWVAVISLGGATLGAFCLVASIIAAVND